MSVPRFMQKGSEGPHVTLLHIFLSGAGLGYPPLNMDGGYGDITIERVQILQKRVGFKGEDLDGRFGPATRQALKDKCHFDFDLVAEAKPGMTKFVQPNGEVVSWESSAEFNTVISEVVARQEGIQQAEEEAERRDSEDDRDEQGNDPL